jgi:16S rRNA (guanine527-N7)-methyltransferase
MKKDHTGASFPENKRSSVRGRRPGPTTTDAPGPEVLAAIFANCGIQLSARQIEQFWLYHGLLRHHNIALNLTRIHNFSNMVLKLYVDSVLPAMMTELPSPLMDLGSGPGMPGIPLKIVRPDLKIHLAEGRTKRTDFLREVVDHLGLADVGIIERNISPGFEQPFDGIITRAVETMDKTLARIQGCLSRKGRMVFMKGPDCEAEIEQAARQFDDRFALVENRPYRIGDTSHERRLVVFERLDAPVRVRVAQAAQRHRVVALASEQNDRFKSLKRMLTGRGIQKEGQALLAGTRPVSEMLTRYPERCRAWITSGEQTPPPDAAPEHMHWLQLAAPLFQELDLFGTRAPLLCIDVPTIVPWLPEEGFPEGCSLLVPFQDPENIGAVIRSAAAFHVTQVILLAESAHPYHPKALRAAGGTTALMRLRQGPSLKELPHNLPLFALSAGGRDIAGTAFPPAFGLLAGLEGQGLPAHWRGTALRIPIAPVVESLNAATATALALYEWRRQRR